MKKNGVILGIFLVVAGLIALAGSLGLLHLRVTVLLSVFAMVAGAVLHIRFLVDREPGSLLPGAIFLLCGCLGFIWSMNGWLSCPLFWSLVLLGPGLGFFEMYLLEKRSRSHLLPAALLLPPGLALLARALILDWPLFWPVLIISVGIFVILYACTPSERYHRGSSAEYRQSYYRAHAPGYHGIPDPNIPVRTKTEENPKEEEKHE